MKEVTYLFNLLELPLLTAFFKLDLPESTSSEFWEYDT